MPRPVFEGEIPLLRYFAQEVPSLHFPSGAVRLLTTRGEQVAIDVDARHGRLLELAVEMAEAILRADSDDRAGDCHPGREFHALAERIRPHLDRIKAGL